MVVVVFVVVPFAGAPAAASFSTSPSASVSFVSGLNVRAVPAGVVTASAVRTGGLLAAAVTVTVTVPVAVPPFPSLSVYEKVSVPEVPLFGV